MDKTNTSDFLLVAISFLIALSSYFSGISLFALSLLLVIAFSSLVAIAFLSKRHKAHLALCVMLAHSGLSIYVYQVDSTSGIDLELLALGSGLLLSWKLAFIPLFLAILGMLVGSDGYGLSFKGATYLGLTPSIVCLAVVILRFRLEQKDKDLSETQVADQQFACRNLIAFSADLERFFNIKQRYDIPCTVLRFDLSLNREPSLDESRDALHKLIEIWTSRIRQTDTLYKISDSTFTCLLPATNAENAQVLMTDLERASQAYDLPHDLKAEVKLTCFGAAQFDTKDGWEKGVYRT